MLKRYKHRGAILDEILKTETNYLNNLNILIEKIMKPLKKQKIITPEESKIIFSNVEQIQALNS